MEGIEAGDPLNCCRLFATAFANRTYDLVSEKWLTRLDRMGVIKCWFLIYRPVGPEPTATALIERGATTVFRQFVVDTRATKPIVVIDAYHEMAGNSV